MGIERVLEIFKELSQIPRGSGDMEKISKYCVDFAVKNSLNYNVDEAFNVIIYKNASSGFESAEPVILQGHLDMVCQKEGSSDIDFLKDGLKLCFEGDFLKAEGTSLGADNGIAVAFILSVLESNNIPHPPIEAVFTTDEEIGMIGAAKLDMSLLKSKRMINLDSETDDILTVSCAGGVEVSYKIPLCFKKLKANRLTLNLKGLKGGHSGVEIDKGRVNADILAGRILTHLSSFEIISINGGDKSNAIPNSCAIELCAENTDEFINKAKDYLNIIKQEISAREPAFDFDLVKGEFGEYEVFDNTTKEKIISLLSFAPNGIMEMSAEIEGLVETSLNLGILKTEEKNALIGFALRSNKASALDALMERLFSIGKALNINADSFGFYPSWEYKMNSKLQELYKECYFETIKSPIKVEAIHAGLECAVFSAGIEGLDCISVGPNLFDVHTTKERLSISSAEKVYKLLLKVLERLV